MATPHVERKLKLLPDLPGCYEMKNYQGRIIYVGKSKDLKHRVRSYFKSSHTGKVAKMVSKVRDFDTIYTSTDKEAFLLEITLIQKYRPYFNIQLKQGHTGYPYIKITHERNPHLMITSNIKDDHGYYFGPYPNVYAADETLDFLQKVYPLRRCHGNQHHRPCLYYHMGQCLGACFKTVPKAVYARQIRRIKTFLNGDCTIAKKILVKKMKAAAHSLEFERAAELRDQLKYIQETVEGQKIISHDYTPRDIFNFYVHDGWISIQVFFLRQARLMRRIKRIFPIISSPIDEMVSFIVQFYKTRQQPLPKGILVPPQLPKDILRQELKIPVKTPERGQKRSLLMMAGKNSRLSLQEKFRLLELDNRKTIGAVEQLSNKLNILPPHRIEAFDHSDIQGFDLVSAMVAFVDGKPKRNLYRKYKLKTVHHADEAASTREVIRRRYSRLLREHKSLPGLILMDGGEIQMNAVRDTLVNELGLYIPVAGMIKNNKHATSDLLFGPHDEHVNLDPHSQAFYMVQRVQDEIHRFVITFHRNLHNRHSLSSQLDLIRGVGPRIRNKLLRHYGALKNIEEASVESLQKLGISEKVAQNIKLSLNHPVTHHNPL